MDMENENWRIVFSLDPIDVIPSSFILHLISFYCASESADQIITEGPIISHCHLTLIQK